MKKYFSLVLIAFTVACNQSENDGNKELQALLHQRDSLKGLYNDINNQLKEVEALIAVLDTASQVRPTLVSTTQLKPERFEHFIEVHGVVESEKNVTLNAEVNGIIKHIKVKRGEQVKEGQVLVILDSDIIQRNIDEVETAFELANSVFLRQEKLWKQNIGSEIQFLEAKNRKESLEQKLRTLKAQKAMTILKAPFSGVVDEIFPKEGETANPMAPMIRLINTESFYVTADVPENHLNSIKTGTEALVKIPSINHQIKANISRVGQYINPNNRTFQVQINLDNPDKILRPNLLSIMMLKSFEADSAAVVPSAAIQQDSKGTEYVMVVDRADKTLNAKKINVSSGLSSKGRTLIIEGLTGNEEIIVEGARGVKENDRIELVN